MPVYDGLDARLYSAGICYHEFKDYAENVTYETPDIRERHLPCFITKSTPGNSYFQVRLTVSVDPRIGCQALAALLIVDGKATNFLSYKVAGPRGIIYLCTEDKALGQNLQSHYLSLRNASIVRLKIFRINTSLSAVPLKPKDKQIFVKGQLITHGQPLGHGDHFVVNDDLSGSNLATFIDGMKKPWVEFIWRCLSKDELEQRSEIPRSPYSPLFKILPNPSLFEPADLKTPITSQNLTKSLDLANLDNLAFDHLNRNKVTDVHSARDLARTFINNQSDVTQMPMQQVLELASLQLQRIISQDVHTRTLCVLGYLNKEEQDGYAKAAIKAATEKIFDAPDHEALRKQAASDIMHARSQVANTPAAILRTLCQKQTSRSNADVSKLIFSDVELFAEKRILEERYLRAKVQVVRLLAEERLLELQKPKIKTEIDEGKIKTETDQGKIKIEIEDDT